MNQVFSDEAIIRHALAFEAALARAQTAEGLLPFEIANEISSLCKTAAVDPAELAQQASSAGTLAIPLVAWLRDHLTPAAAKAVHLGTTSQDVADSVMMMQVTDATALLRTDVERAVSALHELSERHSTTITIGRTLLQDALPISLGLRLAQWRLGINEALVRLQLEVTKNARVQFGGAAGTRAGLKGRGAAVSRHIAGQLGLPDGAPWHGRRGGVAAIGCALAILIGALGKIARDVSLLAQNAVGEAHEPRIGGRGGSSAMPHKRNPTGCQVALSAALRAPGLVATLLSGLPAEYERGLGGWQSEASVLADLFCLAGASAAAMATVVGGLEIDEERIAVNLVTADLGTDIGEACELAAAILRMSGD